MRGSAFLVKWRMVVQIKIKKLHKDAITPKYTLAGDAGLDLFSIEDLSIDPGERKAVPTGIAIELPEGYVSLIWDKSGVALRGGIKSMGGVIERTYRGEYKIILLNTSKDRYIIKAGDKIAQLLIQPIITADVVEVKELSDSPRGQGGFSSTGITSK